MPKQSNIWSLGAILNQISKHGETTKVTGAWSRGHVPTIVRKETEESFILGNFLIAWRISLNGCFQPQSTGILTSINQYNPCTGMTIGFQVYHSMSPWANNGVLSITSPPLVNRKFKQYKSIFEVYFECAYVCMYMCGPKPGDQRTPFRGNSLFLLCVHWDTITFCVLLGVTFTSITIMLAPTV